MKKLSILLIGLLLVTGFAFAELDGTVDISGSATLTWGVDLNTNATGFSNVPASSISVTLVAEQDASASGDDGLYGEIVVEGLEITADPAGTGGSNGTVTAKIVISPIEIIIEAAPGMSWGNATTGDGADADNVAPALVAANTIAGITIVLPVDPATINVYFVSDGDWTVNAANDYAVGTDITVAIDIITIDLGGYYGWFNALGTYGLTAAASVSLADVMGGVDVTVGFDLDETGWEVAFGTVVAVVADAEVSLDVAYSDLWDLDVVLGFAEETAGGLVDMVGAGVTVELFNLLSGAIIWNVDVTGEYSSGGLTPYFGFGYGSDTIFDLNAGVELGADFTGIDNTTVTIDYTSTQLSPAPADSGIITVETVISL